MEAVVISGNEGAPAVVEAAPEIVIEQPSTEEIAASTAATVEIIEANAAADVAVITARAEGEALIETVRQGDDEWRSLQEARLAAMELSLAEIQGLVVGMAAASAPLPSPPPPEPAAPAPAVEINPADAGALPGVETVPPRKSRYARVL